MIQLTKLNDQPFTLNAILIEQVESFPDTTITLINGKKVIVKNPQEEVIRLVMSFYKQLSLKEVYKQMGEDDE